MVSDCIKSPFISNPCVFQSVPNKEGQRRVKLFVGHPDVMDNLFENELGTFALV